MVGKPEKMFVFKRGKCGFIVDLIEKPLSWFKKLSFSIGTKMSSGQLANLHGCDLDYLHFSFIFRL